ncbi:MAG: DUF6102 family protein [Pseudoflavonifractor sp.]|nr:DUF6102 family protein [Pseudoflavonifractor sp.]
MGDLICGFLADLLNDVFRSFDGVLLKMLRNMLKVEDLLDGIVTAGTIHDVYTFIYGAAVSLVVLKFLLKGFQIYILWRDGDADSSPQEMLVGSIQAAVVMVGFPAVYDMMANITTWFTEELISHFGIAVGEDLLFNPITVTAGLFVLILLIVYVVLAFGVAIMLLRRSFDLLVLRLGIPIATIGLVDSDGGVFKVYFQTLLRALFTSIIQIVLFSLSVRLLVGGIMSFENIIFAIATVASAFSSPALMQQILIPTGRGGGVVNKIYTGASAVRAVRGLIGK